MMGGSGWGPSYKRELKAVLRDFLDGYVSLETAANEYGVVVNPEIFEIDRHKTQLKRGALRESGPR